MHLHTPPSRSVWRGLARIASFAVTLFFSAPSGSAAAAPHARPAERGDERGDERGEARHAGGSDEAAAPEKAAAARRGESRQRRDARKARIQGKASWYGRGFQGKATASGEPFDRQALTAAHPDLPFGTSVRVTNRRNGRSIVVRINDRGPFSGERIIDLSEGAARKLDMLRSGVAQVVVEVLPRG